jgi:hypothetical protein
MEKNKSQDPKFSMSIFPLMKFIKKSYNGQRGGSGMRKFYDENSTKRRGRSSGVDGTSEISHDSSGNRGTSYDAANLSFNDQISIGSMFDSVNIENNLNVIGQNNQTKKDLFSFEEQENEEDSEPDLEREAKNIDETSQSKEHAS